MKKILTKRRRYYSKAEDSLNSIHFNVLKNKGLARLCPSIYSYTSVGRKSVYLDFCMNKKGDYEVISSRQDIGTTHGLSARTWMEKKMYRLIFKSVIDAMAHYNTLKQALRSRGEFLIFDKEVAV